MFIYTGLTFYGHGVDRIPLRWLLFEVQVLIVNEGAVNSCDPNFAHCWFRPAFPSTQTHRCFCAPVRNRSTNFAGSGKCSNSSLQFPAILHTRGDFRPAIPEMLLRSSTLTTFRSFWTSPSLWPVVLLTERFNFSASFPSFESRKALRSVCSFRGIATRSWFRTSYFAYAIFPESQVNFNANNCSLNSAIRKFRIALNTYKNKQPLRGKGEFCGSKIL